PVVGVPPVLGLADLLGQRAADGLGRHAVVLADAEVEQRTLRVRRQRLALRTLDLLELVDIRALAVGGAPDAVGETRLEVRIAHGRSLLHAAGMAKQGWQPDAASRDSPHAPHNAKCMIARVVTAICNICQEAS